MEPKSTPDPITLVYKSVSTTGPGSPDDAQSYMPLHLDVYYPQNSLPNNIPSADNDVGVPAVVYFHGGGLVVGDRKSWFPEWLCRRLSEQGVTLISADYRLLSPSNGHQIVEDIRDLFAFVRNDLNSTLATVGGVPKLKINIDAIGVAGSSAGGLCGYLCAIHLSPKPRALLSLYGQAGECLNDLFLEPKVKPFIPDKPLLDPSDFAEFIYPQSITLPITAESPAEYYPSTHPTLAGLPASKRMSVSRLYYQLGEWLDYYTGDHTLSCRLRQLRSSSTLGTELSSVVDPIKAKEVIGEDNIGLFPQFGVAENWPPTMFLHGSMDYNVPLNESEHLAEKLEAVGVENELVVVEGQAHAFDIFLPDVERQFGRIFDRAAGFLVRNLQK